MTRIGKLTATLVMIGIVGCGGSASGPKLIPVTGSVTLDGHLLVGATVSFVPAGKTRGSGAVGTTRDDGTYSLRELHGGNGVTAGDYRVTISRRALPDGSVPSADIPPIESPAKETLPPRFSDPERTELRATVSDDNSRIDFPLASSKK